MQQKSKDSLVIWAGIILGGAGGWWGVTRLTTVLSLPLGTWGVLAGGVIGAITGAALTSVIINDPGAIPRHETD